MRKRHRQVSNSLTSTTRLDSTVIDSPIGPNMQRVAQQNNHNNMSKKEELPEMYTHGHYGQCIVLKTFSIVHDYYDITPVSKTTKMSSVESVSEAACVAKVKRSSRFC
jgi:hypothetical protein